MDPNKNHAREVLRQALKHPLRIRILQISIREPGRVHSASELAETIAGGEEVKVAQVAYHLAQLRDAELVPRPLGR